MAAFANLRLRVLLLPYIRLATRDLHRARTRPKEGVAVAGRKKSNACARG